MRVLVFSTLFPNAVLPTHGIFVENRLRHLVEDEGVEARVVAPVPWYPVSAPSVGRWGLWARVPRRETRFGIPVLHPRYVLPPKVGMTAAPFLLYAAAWRAACALLRDGFAFDLIDAHYLYPDGVAAALLGSSLGRPVTVTARGSDVTRIAASHAVPRALARWAARRVDAVTTVSAGLREALLALGARPRRIGVLRNGVDLELFVPPVDRVALRRALGLTRPTLLSVGYLIPRKRHDLPIAALAGLPGFELLVAGEGPERERLEMAARRAGVADRVRFLGLVPHERLSALYGAADALILASTAEGWANVLLEAMACGTPVLASDIPGTREVVAEPGGVLMRSLDRSGVEEGVRRLLSLPPDRAAVRRYAEGFSWREVSRGQRELFDAILTAGDRSERSGLAEEART